MRFSNLLCCCVLLIAGTTPALAQQGTAYSCTSKNDGRTFGLLVGAHDYWFGSPGDWKTDLCIQDQGADYVVTCGFEGSKFVARVKGEVDFSFDTSSGEYFLAGDEDWGEPDDGGTCQSR